MGQAPLCESTPGAACGGKGACPRCRPCRDGAIATVLVFCQVGRSVELYGQQRLAAVFEKRALAAGAAVVHVSECGEPDVHLCAPRRVTRMVLPYVKE